MNKSFPIAHPFPERKSARAARVEAVLGVFDESLLVVMWSDGGFAAYSVADGSRVAAFEIPESEGDLLQKVEEKHLWLRESAGHLGNEKWILPLTQKGAEWSYLTLAPALIQSGQALQVEKRAVIPFLSGSVEERTAAPLFSGPLREDILGFELLDPKRRQPFAHDSAGNWWVLLPKTPSLR